MSEVLIKNLQNKKLYEHRVENFKVMETHISWVILTGHYAYKIKKAHDFGFLDFTSLEKRKHFCELELSLNKKLAPELYIDVLPITGSADQPQINGNGDAIEYAIKMKEFDQADLFDSLLQNNRLTADHIRDVASIMAEFHQKTQNNGPEYFGTADQIFDPVIQNFDQIKPLLESKEDLDKLENIEDWSKKSHESLTPTFTLRKENGFIRACHGDIHLGNITLFESKPMIFDCIEFNESFRWTDTMADLGFLMMDLHFRNQYSFASILLSQYMQDSGDYEGLKVLNYYLVYRAVVRAKIALFERMQYEKNSEKYDSCTQLYRNFITLIETYIKPKSVELMITHGLSGSGKSTLAKTLVADYGLIQIRSDLERKRMYGLQSHEKSHSGLYQDLYSADKTDATYRKLKSLADTTLDAGFPVLIDATFLKEKHRRLFIDLANNNKVPMFILNIQAPLETLKTWLKQRAQKDSVSEADIKVLLAQQDELEALTEKELEYSIDIDARHDFDTTNIIAKIKRKSHKGKSA